MEKPKIKDLPLVEIQVMIANKMKALQDLSNWLQGHSPEEEQYKKVAEDRKMLQEELNELEKEYANRNKPFKRSLNESFEL